MEAFVLAHLCLAAQGPATTGLPMPGPGFFSSPERPAGAYNAGRFVAPASGALNGVSPQLYPPRPGFIPTIGSPASATQTAPSAAVANPTGKSLVIFGKLIV